jgi:hypothetical protein
MVQARLVPAWRAPSPRRRKSCRTEQFGTAGAMTELHRDDTVIVLFVGWIEDAFRRFQAD